MTTDDLILIVPLEKKWSGEAKAASVASRKQAAGQRETPAQITKRSTTAAATEKSPTEKADATEKAIELARERRKTANATRKMTETKAAADVADGQRLADNMASVRAVTHQQEKTPKGSAKREEILPSNVRGRR